MTQKKRAKRQTTGFFNIPESIALEKLPPAKSLLLASMACEKKVAHIRSMTVDCLQKKDVMEIGHRYLQNKKGRLNTSYEIMGYSLVALIALINLCVNPEYIKLPSMFFYLANILPNTSNRERYEEAETHCAKALTDHFGQQEFSEIEKLQYDKKGLESLEAFMSRHNIISDAKNLKCIKHMPSGLSGLLVSFLPPEFGIVFILVTMLRAIYEAFSESTFSLKESDQRNYTNA